MRAAGMDAGCAFPLWPGLLFCCSCQDSTLISSSFCLFVRYSSCWLCLHALSSVPPNLLLPFAAPLAQTA